MKIIITEQQLNELFSTKYSYPFKRVAESEGDDYKFYRYSFFTKDNVEYRVLLDVWKKNNAGRLDFDTVSKENPEYNSNINLIGTHDSIKVFNTIKNIIDSHPELNILVADSIPERIKFYKKIFDHMGFNSKIDQWGHLILYLKPKDNEQQINELFPEKILNLYRTDREQELYNTDIDFNLKYKNAISQNDYWKFQQGKGKRFTQDEETKMSLIFGDYRKANLNMYQFKYTRSNFGEPDTKITGTIHKFEKYYLINFNYKVRLPQAKGEHDSYGMFIDFQSLIKFLNQLTTKDLYKQI